MHLLLVLLDCAYHFTQLLRGHVAPPYSQRIDLHFPSQQLQECFIPRSKGESHLFKGQEMGLLGVEALDEGELVLEQLFLMLAVEEEGGLVCSSGRRETLCHMKFK